MSIVFMFPGQGSQATGMGKELYGAFPVFKDVFDRADEALGLSLTDICFSDNRSGELNDTEFAQPALLTMGMACFELLRERGFSADYALGLSLGEYTALTAAGAFTFEDAVRLVRRRGQIMKESILPGFGGMSAILGLENALCEKACVESSNEDSAVYCANYNTPGQLVISGELNALERAEKLCLEYGAKRAVRLNVTGPFHTKHMLTAAEKLAKELAALTIREPEIRVISNVNGKAYPSRDAIAPSLFTHMVSPVRFEQSIRFLLEERGANTFVELGPGRSLSAFVKKIDKSVVTLNIEDIKSFEATLAALGGK